MKTKSLRHVAFVAFIGAALFGYSQGIFADPPAPCPFYELEDVGSFCWYDGCDGGGWCDYYCTLVHQTWMEDAGCATGCYNGNCGEATTCMCG